MLMMSVTLAYGSQIVERLRYFTAAQLRRAAAAPMSIATVH